MNDLARRIDVMILPLRVVWGRWTVWLVRVGQRRKIILGLTRFVRQQEPLFQRRLLTEMDPARVVCLADFSAFFSVNREVSSVAVVSGSLREPELRFLPSECSVELLNFTDNPHLFDLEKDWSGRDWEPFLGKYDLVLCEQVLEHVVNPELAVRNLAKLLKPQGILHVSVPAVNNRHGGPRYFFSGFAIETIEHWFRGAGLEVLHRGSWDSNKGSRMYSTSDWAPLASSGPIIFFVLALFLKWTGISYLFLLFRGKLRDLSLYPAQPLFPIRPSRNSVSVWAVGRPVSASSMLI